ncbi:unannotated protein [freshwater metagenome]|uniref:Unannotated protein n=1 Tax=freshwater metagenome TaxID=449393 RepID=A0A6J7SK67_9ZZZZ
MPDLVYVISDNNGGGIFSQLEQGAPKFANSFERVFGTPLDADIPAAVIALGFACHVATTLEELNTALKEALAAGGVHVLVARTCSRADEVVALQNVNDAIRQALATA